MITPIQTVLYITLLFAQPATPQPEAPAGAPGDRRSRSSGPAAAEGLARVVSGKGATGARGAAAELARVVSGRGATGARGASAELGGRVGPGDITASPGVPLVLLTEGRCLLRIAPGARARLSPPAPGTRCPEVTLQAGRLAMVAALGDRPALRLGIGRGEVGITLIHGTAVALAKPSRGLCLESGRARAGGPGGAGVRPRATGVQPGAAGEARPSGSDQAASASSGQCLWLGERGITASGYSSGTAERHQALLVSDYTFRAPDRPLQVNLGEAVERVRQGTKASGSQGAEVEGGSQSMCLETGGEGGAADLGNTGSVEIVKPPPPTDLRIRIQLQRSQR